SSHYQISRWDLSSGLNSQLALSSDNGFSPFCFVGANTVLGATVQSKQGSRVTLQVADESGIRELKQPPFALSVFGLIPSICFSAISGGTVLLPSGADPPTNPTPDYFTGKGQKTDLYWISTQPQETRFCCSIIGEFLKSYALSPDGQLVVA